MSLKHIFVTQNSQSKTEKYCMPSQGVILTLRNLNAYRLLCADQFYVWMTFIAKLMSKIIDVCNPRLIGLDILQEVIKFLLQHFNMFKVSSNLF